MIHKIVIFGGTSEGRELAEWSADHGFDTVVSVATEYGRQVLSARPNLRICEGRLDGKRMKVFLLREIPDLVVDATHPHAVEITRTIRETVIDCKLPWVRVVREELTEADETRDDESTLWKMSKEYQAGNAADILHVRSAAEAAQMLEREKGAVLLTTGSRELMEFVQHPGLRDRIFARVLPDSRVLATCEKMGVRGKRLLAMQGPFSEEMNVAMLHMTDAKWMVTKESGISGGFYEKLKAARQCNVRTIVIERPEHEKGITAAELKARLLALKNEKIRETDTVSLIGMGMGGGGQLTLEAVKALSMSDIIFGAERMLTDVHAYTADQPMMPLYRGKEILDYLDAHSQFHAACVVYSGDTGYHSGCADFLSELRLRGSTYIVRIYPGISTFSCLCARFQLRGETIFAASAHGREEDVVSLLKKYGRVFLLLDSVHTIGSVCRNLMEAGYGATRVFAGIRLGYPDERLMEDRADRLTRENTDPLAAMILEREDLINAG